MAIKEQFTNGADYERALAIEQYSYASKPTRKEAGLCSKRAAGALLGSSAMLEIAGLCKIKDCKVTCEPKASTLDQALQGPCLIETIGIMSEQKPEQAPKAHTETLVYVKGY